MSNLLKSVIVFAILLVVASSTLYVVSETERGVKLRFGRLIEADIQPGSTRQNAICRRCSSV